MPVPLVETFPVAFIEGYHAHVYYADSTERAIAAAIREAAQASFELVIGRWRDEPVGPHPLPMYQIAFGPDVLPAFLPWLLSVRGPLSILVHTRTGVSDLTDHTVGAMWLGKPLELKLEFFDRDGKSA
ncbi:MAG TPA: DOPA 4,5-dioxygenase family protein [Gammaproteobacteria bacterium]|nr:DOPA 4,5-dioxygenase family protein [Gammaproteobacteria bacterium]